MCLWEKKMERDSLHNAAKYIFIEQSLRTISARIENSIRENTSPLQVNQIKPTIPLINNGTRFKIASGGN